MNKDASFGLKKRWKSRVIALLALASLCPSVSAAKTVSGPESHVSGIAPPERHEETRRRLSQIDQYNREIRDLNEWFVNLPSDRRAGQWNRLVDEITRRGAAIDRLYDEIDRLEADRRLHRGGGFRSLDGVATEANGNARK